MKRLLLALLVTLAMPASAAAHPPDAGRAAGVYSIPTYYGCPGGQNGYKCSWYGRARCWRPAGYRHSVRCLRDSTDKRILNGARLKLVWRSEGNVDHIYRVHAHTVRIIGWTRW